MFKRCYELLKEVEIAMVQLEQHFDISDEELVRITDLNWLLSTFVSRMLTFWQKK